MALEILSQDVVLNGGSTSFQFNNSAVQFLAGIASFQLSYGDDDHHVEQLSIQLVTNKPSSQVVNVGAIAILQDASGHSIDLSSSYVTVTVIAWDGTQDVLLSPVYTVSNGEQSDNIPLPGQSDPILQSALAGFSLNYNGTDHEISQVAGAVSVGQNLNEGYISATAVMNDASGNQAVNPTASGALIASSLSAPGFVIAKYEAQAGSEYTSIPMGTTITNAVSFLTGFRAQYPGSSDHHIQTIGAGPNQTGVDPNDSTKAQTNGVWAWMNDTSGNNQDNNNSYASIIVVGITG